MPFKTTYFSPIGKLTLVSNGKSLLGLFIEGQKYFLSKFDKMIENDNLEIFHKTKVWLERYFNGEKPNIKDLSLSPQGSDFANIVWSELIKIPYGQTITYGELALTIARKLGKVKMSAQAIGGAVGHNPISIIIPCHRVVGKNGNLTGYAGGLDLKIKLLEHEKLDMTKFYLPKK